LYIHGGVSFAPYRDQFRHLIRKDNMHYMETYNASEGFFGIQHDLTNTSMLLMLDYGIYFEFIPADRALEDNPPVLLLQEVEPGVNYSVVISTNSGLWRYQLGDTIRFTETKPYTFRITGRVKHFINAFGEEVIVDNTDEALARACRATGALVRDYTVAPVYFSDQNNGRHEWLIEFEKRPENTDSFMAVLDTELKALNSDYEAKRYKDIALSAPSLHVAPDGLFREWLKRQGKLGGQHKVPRLSNDRKFMDSLLELMKVYA